METRSFYRAVKRRYFLIKERPNRYRVFDDALALAELPEI